MVSLPDAHTHTQFLSQTHAHTQELLFISCCCCYNRKLGTAGQRLGGSAALCHIRHGLVAPSDRGGGGCFTVTAANVGRCQAVLCRDGKALPLSTTHTIRQQSEYQRARQHHAIITEVHTHCTVCMSLSVCESVERS